MRVVDDRGDPAAAACGSPGIGALQCAPDDLAPGTRRVGDFELDVAVLHHGWAATYELGLRSCAPVPRFVESVLLGFHWSGFAGHGLRFLRNGWQSWSETGVRDLDPAGEPPFPSGPWLRGMHHCVGAPPPDRSGWHESELVGVASESPDGASCLAGVLETGRGFGIVYLREEIAAGGRAKLQSKSGAGGLLVEIEIRVERFVDPGACLELEAVRVALGDDPERLLEGFAGCLGARAGARTSAPFQAGWCSWYHLFHDVSEQDLLRNLDHLAGRGSSLGLDVVQLDDGYQRATGDWLDTNDKFPRGLEPLAAEIRAAGFRPGLWTAPFCVVAGSRLHAQQPDWLLGDPASEAPFQALLHPGWSEAGWVYALDPARDEVVEHLRALFRALTGMGWSYLKLDFLYVAAMQARSSSLHVGRAERLRRGLEAIREGAGEAAFLLGCGSPLGAAVGVVDAMRVGADVAPHWAPSEDLRVPGIESTLPALRNSLRGVIGRGWMHRRLWLNDPDCLLARSRDTDLGSEERHTLASSVALGGGVAMISDDLPSLGDRELALARETLALARRVDAADGRGVLRCRSRFAPGELEVMIAGLGNDALLALVNPGDSPLTRELNYRELGLAPSRLPEPLLGTTLQGRETGAGASGSGAVLATGVELAPHESVLLRLAGARHLAVFCDFDGTFSVQDVGSTLARTRMPERRAELWERFETGEFTAWSYAVELLDGIVLPPAELDLFLETIDLDPGAGALVDWCKARRIPFRILSDGFDYNLERLQKLHGVRFDYASNHLAYEGDVWRISPGRPDPDCGCGTGSCKRGIIDAYRAATPGAFCVHVGNGAVSDLCGAVAADLAFAKDTLAPALDERGEAYEPFESLHEVVAVLERFSAV
ncbi:MAG: alpha-galactosidase [Deltaproteobacteria bacterium]|nr:alpha-galactosidase [Deltaproteobacteria bacterium]